MFNNNNTNQVVRSVNLGTSTYTCLSIYILPHCPCCREEELLRQESCKRPIKMKIVYRLERKELTNQDRWRAK